MRRLVISSSVLALAVTVVSAPVSAQFYVGAYASVPSGDFGEFAKTGWMAEAGYKFFETANEKLSLYASGSYARHSLDTDLFEGNYTSLIGAGHVVYDLAEGNVSPYLIGTAGYLSLKEKIDDESTTEGGILFGGGLGAGIGPRFWIEGRFLTASIEESTISMLVIGGGISF